MLRTKLLSLAAYLLIFFHADAVTPDSTAKEVKSFVIIGAFSFQNNAKRFVEHVKEDNIDAHYAMNPSRHLYYVYAHQTQKLSDAIVKMRELRLEEEFNDAWVFKGILEHKGDEDLIFPANYQITADQNVVDSNTGGIDSKEAQEPTSTNSAVTSPTENVVASAIPSPIKPATPSAHVSGERELQAEVEAKKFDYMVYVNALHNKKFKEVKGKIDVYDNKRHKKMGEIETHKLEGVNDPKNGEHAIRMVSNIFGYRPQQMAFDLTQPEKFENDSTADAIEVMGDSIVLHLNLERLRAGDVAVMWSVLFYKDAAIMRAESKPQLDDLLAMLKENENMSIAIHGHTNGNSSGNIIHLDLEDKNFFNINGNHVESQGSAKKLSEFRAYTIQHYLIENGIPESRMQIKGWGGKKMLYDKHDSMAKQNVRVEIEILTN